MLTAGAREAQNTLVAASTEAANHVKSLAADVERTLTSVGTNTAQSILGSARDAQSSFVATSSEAATQIRAISVEIERSLTTASAESAERL